MTRNYGSTRTTISSTLNFGATRSTRNVIDTACEDDEKLQVKKRYKSLAGDLLIDGLKALLILKESLTSLLDNLFFCKDVYM